MHGFDPPAQATGRDAAGPTLQSDSDAVAAEALLRQCVHCGFSTATCPTLLAGCVQPALRPQIGAATRRVFDAAGIEVVSPPSAGCCGAIRAHLGDHDGGLADMRRNIDTWWPALDSGQVESIVIDASGCGAMVKEYGQALADDPRYAEKAQQVAAAARDVSEWLPELSTTLAGRLRPATTRLAYHAPCSLQHAQQLRGGVEHHLRALGFDLLPPPQDSHLCCGSAGTYAVLQPALATTLRQRKLTALQAGAPGVLISANIGCIGHLQAGTATPVRHWVELLAEALP